ncbi:MAG: SH3 domain-containing protein, partial [Chloroflexi bacterium]
MYRYATLIVGFVLLMLGGALFQHAGAQAGGTCPALVEQALSAMDDNCGGLERNSACYGYNQVSATFLEEVSEDFFTQPSDRTTVSILAKLTTSPLNLETNEWGVAVMSLQANVPNTLPGQAVTFILLGDAELENAVEPEDAFTPADPVPVFGNVREGANVRSGPGLNFNVIGALANNDRVEADGIDPTGDWLRIVYNDRIGWVSLSVIAVDTQALATLPVLDGTQRMPMQAFYLRTGIGQPTCNEISDDVLVVQGPKNLEVEFTVNGADVRIGSTVLFRILPPGDLMEIIVLDGHAIVTDPDTGAVKTVFAGYRSVVCLSEPDNLGIDGESNDRVVSCGWSEPEPVQLDTLQGWCVLEGVPEDLLNYPIDLLCPGDPPPAPPQEPVSQNTGGVDCSNFRLTHPLFSIPAGPAETFYWDEAHGVDDYRIIFYNSVGAEVASYNVGGTTPNITLNTRGLPIGGVGSWRVQALLNGEVVCDTGQTAPLVHEADTNNPPGATATPDLSSGVVYTGPGQKVVWECINPAANLVQVSWFGYSVADNLDISYNSQGANAT